MRLPAAFRRARPGALLVGMAIGALLSGCTAFHHSKHADVGCKRPVFTGNADELGPLKAPPGLSSPDAAQEIKIPALNVADPARPRTAPCLDWPPQYVNEPLLPPTRRSNG